MADSDRRPRVLIGLVLLAAGALFLLENLTGWHVTWGRWWPVILIVVGISNLVRRNASRWVGTVITAVGVLFLLDTLNIWGFRIEDIWRFWPVILLLLGAKILLGGRRARSRRLLKGRSTGDSGSGELNITCLFGGTEQRVTSPRFSGGQATAVFGGAKIDLRDAVLAEGEATIDITAVFGGATLRVPDNWAVDIRTVNLLGGIEDKRNRPSDEAAGGRLTITGLCLFGGITLES